MYHISNDKRSKESSAMIYEALERLIQLKDYSAIKVTELCLEAQVGRVTFYRHFDTIDDVLQMKCDEQFNELLEYFKLQSELYQEQNRMFKLFLRFWYNNASIIEVILKADKTPIITHSFMKMYETLKVLSKRPESDYEHENYFIATRAAIMVSILTVWINNNQDMSPDQLSDVVASQFNLSFNPTMFFE